MRDWIRTLIPNFVEVYVDCPATICEERDAKGLYAKARAGGISNFTGVNDPYEPPTCPHLILKTEYATVDDCVDLLMEYLVSEEYLIDHGAEGWSLFIGRYQPPHKGHETLIRTALKQGRRVCIGVRETKIDENNPLTAHQRVTQLSLMFKDEIAQGRVKLKILPDITEVCYGRDVGWGIRQIHLPEEIEAISGTEIRREQQENDKRPELGSDG
jgi:cytidyltransferase-like protein